MALCHVKGGGAKGKLQLWLNAGCNGLQPEINQKIRDE
jgi:hypothetical protein